MDPRLEALDGLVRELESLLGALDGEEAGAHFSALAWQRCQSAFEGFRDLQSERREEPLPDAVRARIEDALRLHAVASSSVQRARLEVEGEMSHLKAARDRLRSARGQASESRSCDVRG